DRAEALAAALDAQLPRAAADAYEALRVVAGRPRWGRDYDASHFPQETGLEAEAVDYDKGCYLGQEVVARIHFRGGVQRGLRGLRLDPHARAVPGDALQHDTRSVGTVGTVVVHPDHGRIALAVVHQRAWDADGPLTVTAADGLAAHGRASIAPLPFAPADG
ncbi:MAG: tRNA-modifying protein YgfZ, partial [Acidobacteriota bacterium]